MAKETHNDNTVDVEGGRMQHRSFHVWEAVSTTKSEAAALRDLAADLRAETVAIDNKDVNAAARVRKSRVEMRPVMIF